MKPIQFVNRSTGRLMTEDVPGGWILRCLYGTFMGKAGVWLLVQRKFLSAIAGRIMDRTYSKRRIEGFIRRYNINIKEYEQENLDDYKTFNQFFYRKLKAEARPIGEGVVSPADGRVLAFQRVSSARTFFVKGVEFCLDSFLIDSELASKYKNGSMLIIRLAPVDYHRFHFPVSGTINESKLIKGSYYSVSPLALRKSLEIFCRNKRTISLLNSENNGSIVYSDIGATMVGSIIQTYKVGDSIKKGDEKGYFAFGGSSLLLLFEPGKIKFSDDLLNNTQRGFETFVKMGENIGW